jgi:hypothetical protein
MAQLLIPAYLLTLGFPLPQVFLFFIIMAASAIPATYASAYWASKVTPNVIMATAQVFVALSFIALALVPVLDIPLWVPAVLKGIEKGLYWPAFHLNFSKSRLHKKADAEVGMMSALVIIAGGIAPATGGIVASLFGIAWIYGVSAGLLAFAAVAILTGKDIVKHRPFKPRQLSRAVIPDLLANATYSSTMIVEIIVWPLFIFLLLKSYAGIGILSSVVVLSSALAAYIVGKRADRRGERHYLKEGSWVGAITNATRLLAASAAHVFGINLLGGISQSLLGTSMTSRYYKHADKDPRLEYIWAMETAHLCGWVILLSILFVLASTVSASLTLTIILLLAVPLSFGVRLMR